MFSQAIADEICTRLAEGQSLTRICKDAEMPALMTVLDWTEHPDRKAFGVQYAQARARGYALLGEQIIEIADDKDIDPANKRIMFDARRWMLSKMLPKVYGDKIEHDHKGGLTLTVSPQDERL